MVQHAAPAGAALGGSVTGYRWPMTDYKAGDVFNVEDLHTEGPDCPGEIRGGGAFCVLSLGHSGQHVAADASLRVVAVWQ